MAGGGPHTSPVSWVSAPGGQRHSLGGVGRSAHQMTSHPSIDLFIVAPVALLTQGNRALSCAHVPGFAVIWGGRVEGRGEEGHGE